jgi:hypothetical protein
MRKQIVVAHGDPERRFDDGDLMRKATGVLQRLAGAPPAAAVVELGLSGLSDAAACRRLAEAMRATCRE